MIAQAGAAMFGKGITTHLSKTWCTQRYRTDAVEVTWVDWPLIFDHFTGKPLNSSGYDWQTKLAVFETNRKIDICSAYAGQAELYCVEWSYIERSFNFNLELLLSGLILLLSLWCIKKLPNLFHKYSRKGFESYLPNIARCIDSIVCYCFKLVLELFQIGNYVIHYSILAPCK